MWRTPAIAVSLYERYTVNERTLGCVGHEHVVVVVVRRKLVDIGEIGGSYPRYGRKRTRQCHNPAPRRRHTDSKQSLGSLRASGDRDACSGSPPPLPAAGTFRWWFVESPKNALIALVVQAEEERELAAPKQGRALSYYHVILWAPRGCQILCFSGNTKKWGVHCLICALRLVLSTVLEGPDFADVVEANPEEQSYVSA